MTPPLTLAQAHARWKELKLYIAEREAFYRSVQDREDKKYEKRSFDWAALSKANRELGEVEAELLALAPSAGETLQARELIDVESAGRMIWKDKPLSAMTKPELILAVAESQQLLSESLLGVGAFAPPETPTIRPSAPQESPQEKQPVEDTLHAVFTRHGIASRADLPHALISDLIGWAAAECRHATKMVSAPQTGSSEVDRLIKTVELVLIDGLREEHLKALLSFDLPAMRQAASTPQQGEKP